MIQMERLKLMNMWVKIWCVEKEREKEEEEHIVVQDLTLCDWRNLWAWNREGYSIPIWSVSATRTRKPASGGEDGGPVKDSGSEKFGRYREEPDWGVRQEDAGGRTGHMDRVCMTQMKEQMGHKNGSCLIPFRCQCKLKTSLMESTWT